MKIAKITSALLLAGLLGNAQADPTTLLSEGFDNVAGLGAAGWVFQNASFPSAGNSWFQGNSGVFASQSGADGAYIAADFLSAPSGGFIDNLLITPYFSLVSDVTLTFWARGDVLDGFADTFAVLAGTTAGSALEAVTQVLADTTAGGEWTKYSVVLAGQGAGATGRFAFEYFGTADTSNYMGIDTVTVAVPEPETYAMMGLGLAALALYRRRKAA